MKFYEESGQRLMIYDYYDMSDIDIGCIPYSAIQRALRHEIFFRKSGTTFNWQKDLHNKIYSSVLVRFPDYIAYLYEHCMEGKSYKEFFGCYHPEILESFEYLFPDVIKRLDRMTKVSGKLNKGIFSELDLKRIK